MSEQDTMAHVWIPGGYSLCMTARRTDAAANAPTCGSCVLLAGRLRRDAVALMRRPSGAPAEATPYAAWQSLLGSPWADEFDLRTFLATRKELIDHDSRFEAIALAVDDVRVDERLAEWGFAPPK